MLVPMDDNSGFETYACGICAYQWIAGRKLVALGRDREEALARLGEAIALDGRLQERIRAGKHLLPAGDR
jgi:hypothetical protein